MRDGVGETFEFGNLSLQLLVQFDDFFLCLGFLLDDLFQVKCILR